MVGGQVEEVGSLVEVMAGDQVEVMVEEADSLAEVMVEEVGSLAEVMVGGQVEAG